jgi:sigma-B regulation protein RsbU (phosphoserine phosphatase)
MESITHMIGQVAEIIAGTFFLFISLGAFILVLIRRDKNAHILFWLGMWSGSYGLRLLIDSPLIIPASPHWLQTVIPYMDVVASYLILLFALLTGRELTRNWVRSLLKVMALFSLFIAVTGISRFIYIGDPVFVMPVNNLIALVTLFIFIIILVFRSLTERFLILSNRGLLAAATLLFAGEAFYTNLARFFNFPVSAFSGWIGFAVLLSALTISAVRIIFNSEKRLLTIENELTMARKIQYSILPAPFPEKHLLSVAAAYCPMREVAGDLYDFLLIDEMRSGFLVADVSGHGVPAVLIASMVKIAVQSAAGFADDPAKVLMHLSDVIGGQLHGQFVTASYLYIDSANDIARYSAAGHPPLYHCQNTNGKLERVISNGLMICNFCEKNYPVIELEIHPGDRFIMVTDGLTEAENKAGEQFGDKRFMSLLNTHRTRYARELNGVLYKELKNWIPDARNQQDDFTWIIIDVKE